ncbi:MAG TPA: tetratricopeptide repeat-containing sensor histidine kinase, partial [Saprospiraceae bacterium]|nr:tetratricopeptide repeat-containing sensor histidine kinase [Saprospiraceae bacterium]
GVVYNNLGSIYAAQKKYNQAEKAFFKSLDYVNSIDAKFVVLENYQNLMDLYEQMKDYKSQSIYLKKYYQLKDSIYAIDKLNELNQLESEYQLEKKNSEILKKDKAFIKSNSQRNIFILIAFSILLALALLFLFYKKLQSKNHIVERQKEELLTLNHVKDRLFSIISHDLRNPLVTLKSYLLLSDSESISADKKLLFKNQTISAVVQTGDLLDNLLTWANLQIKNTSANIVPVSIQECVGDVVSVVDYQAKQKNIQIIQKIEPLIIPANMDILSIALRNLITNAIKFSFKNSEIIIKTIQSDDYTLLVVEDHGVGISNEKLELIQMNQNESTPGTNGERGSGLGLYLVKEMLKKINAQLQVESILEKGSKFIIKIPR